MDITNYTWWYQTLNQVIFQNWVDCYVHAYMVLNKFICDSNIYTLFIIVFRHI
jgi:hypothetical protein